ncbi:hypothetical protein [Zunongwangia atlantica]|uniref:Uncharacterized protein n=1 Tax=Zunongwangia atlantica 22II14-10F7 TaxID=1185767 RepID=A0A1Y1SYZ5_9FLAO|nr:hypothetical protein [Zunongwangia atlantica]ORL43792.1 hypothetical protein IIF7_19109 [Zunongwangia atlantica 22II14-10F7]
MRPDLIAKLEYIKLCAERAILQEKKEMEVLGSWYIDQELSEIERSLQKCRSIFHEGRQIEMFNQNEN